MIQCVSAAVPWRAACLNIVCVCDSDLGSALVQCMSLLRVMHFYGFSLANRLFLGALLVSVKCVGVYRRECIFNYWES